MVKRVFLLAAAFMCLSSIAYAGVEFPKEIETEFPMYEGCSAFQVTNMDKGLIATIKCDGAAVEAVYDFYKQQAEAAGYAIAMTTRQEQNMMFMAQKGSKNVAVNITRDNGTVLVNFTVVSQ